MYNKDFYPTPEAVAKMMVAPFIEKLKKFQLTILEPSAGTGDLLEHIKNCSISPYGNDSLFLEQCYAIEIDPELSAVLQDKGYTLVASDFLTFEPFNNIDLIIMNPPFSNGDEHLIHAWDILGTGDIVCLLNAETINNPYTERRRLLLKVIEDHGSVEMIGKAFADAPRLTNVEIALVRLHKEVDNYKFDFGFTAPKDDAEERNEPNFNVENSTMTDLKVKDEIGDILYAYAKSKEAMIDVFKSIEKLKYYSAPFYDEKSYQRLTNDLSKAIDRNPTNKAYNFLVKMLKRYGWRHLLYKMNFDKYMTSTIYHNFNNFVEQQANFELTRDNIVSIITFLSQNADNILKGCIVEVFDIFTKYYKENRCYVEGWKTNDQWKANKRIILPWGCRFHSYESRYRTGDRNFYDIDKCMCYLSGVNFDNITTISEVIESTCIGDSKWHMSSFFKIRCYKKGTVHIEFLDEKLWEKFNIEACKGKNWIGYK